MIWGCIFGSLAMATFMTMKDCFKRGHTSYIDIDTPLVFMCNLIVWLIVIVIFLCCKLYGGE